ncbi:PAS domain-containing sensor histidine kinase, partial [Escherichia coli]|nr:PAS domain-containing sensor histidine kinase [Escherichia coli]
MKDHTTKILRCKSVPMIINERTVGIIGYAVDISKEKERERLLRKTEKLSVVGELAASVAHEIR